MLQYCKNKILIVLLFCNYSHSLIGQSYTYNVEDILTFENGLLSNKITTIKQYKEGLLLIGTDKGLHIYDGYGFIVINTDPSSLVQLNDDRITSMELDLYGRVWIGSHNGVNVINPFTKENISYFNSGNKEVPPFTKSKTFSTQVVKSTDGTIWIVNDGILCRIIDGQVQKYHSNDLNNVRMMVADNKNHLYGRSNDYIFCIDSKGNLKFRIKSFSSPTVQMADFDYDVHSLFNSKDGDIIMVDYFEKQYHKIDTTGLIEKLDPSTFRLARVFQKVDEYSIKIHSSKKKKTAKLCNSDDLVWVGTDQGLYKVSVNKQYFETIPELNKFSCRGMYEDENGVIYGGSYRPGGLYKYDLKRKKIEWDKSIENVFKILSIGEDSLLLISDGTSHKLFNPSSNKILDELKNKGKLYTAVVDQSGKINFGSFEANRNKPFDFKEIDFPKDDPMLKNYLVDIHQLSDGSFLSATIYGVLQYRKETGTTAIYNTYQNEEQKILSNEVKQLVLDKNENAWVATSGGLNLIDTKNQKVLKSYTFRDGLPDNVIYSMEMENDSIFWLGTGSGLSRFDILKEEFINFHEKDGIASDEFNTGSHLKTKSGLILMGGVKGVTIIDPQNLEIDVKPHISFLSRYLKYNTESGQLNTFFHGSALSDPIIIEKEEEYIQFHFANNDFYNPKKNTFACYLEGYEKDWIPQGNQKMVRYSNLPAGEYTFHLKTLNHNGTWSAQGLRIPVIVEQYFYESTWFIIVCILAILTGMFSFFYLESKRIKFRMFIREKLARDLHDEMSNSFNNIRIIAKEIEPNNIDKTIKDASIIEEMSGQAIGLVEDVIWSIGHGNEKVEDLLFKMEDFLDDVIRAKDIPMTFTVVNMDRERNLNYLYRRNLLLIFKEAITNIVKHSTPTNVEILFEEKKDHIDFFVTSTYSELKKAEYSTGKGLKIMRRRARLVLGDISVKEGPNTFCVSMKMKIP